jgi:hypothetical protein
LLKSTLLQLDSSFSERDYGVSSFREFADKLAEHGLVALKQQGRSTLVELPGDSAAQPAAEPIEAVDTTPLREILEQPDSRPAPAEPAELSLGDGVALVRKALAEAGTPPRWPMYPRQFKQFLKNAQPDFEERRYGSINDLMRACQKDGLLRLERDRQGGLRVFASNAPARSSVPHGWGLHRGNGGSGQGNGQDPIDQHAPSEPAAIDVVVEPIEPPVIEAAIIAAEPEPAQPAEPAELAEPRKAKRASRSRKTVATAEKKKPSPRKKKTTSAV